MSIRLKEVLEQPMDRRQFLGRIGVVLLAVFGFSNIFRALHGGQSEQSLGGYGSNAYGK